LNKILGAFEVERVEPHFQVSQGSLTKRITAALPSLSPSYSVDAEFAHSGFVQIVPKDPKDCSKIVTRLKKSDDVVWNAYVSPRPVPAAATSKRRASGGAKGGGKKKAAAADAATGTAPEGKAAGSRNFETAQGYLHAPPNGIGAMAVWSLKGGRGEGVTICDIEGEWNLTHEDLPRNIQLIGGKVAGDLQWRNHGTAVLGEMVSLPSNVGTVGICHKAGALVHSAFIDGVFNAAGAIAAATAKLSAGDVILVELQAIGPTGTYIAMQYWDAVFSAIRAATDKGIVVVEAAGNGGEDFNQAIFKDSGLQKDCGAIVVGAGIPPTNFFDAYGFPPTFAGYTEIGVPRSRLWFSNYGQIVNLQGWGWHVTTLGYGDAQGGAGEDRWYTSRFSGTSSASPIVTGAVACLQGRAKALGQALTPAKVRSILKESGTPQEAGSGVPLDQHIGPLPNLPNAFKRLS
jgi:subtilisin family serine protease